MAKLGFHLLCILFTFAFSTVHPRTISPATTVSTSELDVTDSIQKSLNVLSFSPQPQQSQMLTSSELSSSSSSSSILSLQLHSRVAVHKSSHKSYKSVTLARLARDSARVESLQTRLDLAVNGVKKSDLKPVDTELSVENLEVPVVSGTSQGSGEYFCRVGIGHPASQAYMVLDTGSDVNWLQCAPCADCYQQADPIFEPASSSSYSPLTCDAHQCKSLDVSECRNGTCLYEVSYGDGSYTVGDFVTETLTLQGSTTVENIAIGCGHNNEGLFVGAAGLIGLGGGRLSFPSQINATSYSYCLVDRDSDSASTLEFNSPIPHDAITAPLLRNSKLDTFYYIGLTGISVPTVSFHFTNGKKLDLPAKNYLIPVDSSGTFCFAFAPTSSSLSIIGNVQQQGTRVSYDLENSVIGFSPNKC
ncbi:putative nepenthesin [Helianthus annuus]|nr:putative nepenthesin [Helianthus annuus]KAJ0462376.1 putative nepenthesin [Helianthus annuus]KAJ0642783.1 putative nepenthesin [Helianthus annuus]